MLIGVPKEIKPDEYRIGLTPESVLKLTEAGHEIMILTQAGHGIGKSDQEYMDSGAVIAQSREEVFDRADMIIKVKEPQLDECALLKKDQILFTYLHLAPDPDQIKALITSGSKAIAYESVKAKDGSYPLLTPMSEVAGRMAVQAGANCLEKAKGGMGLLMGGVTGVEPANVVVIGGGVVGTNAIEIAIGMQANVTVLDKSAARLDYLESVFGDRLNAVLANDQNNTAFIEAADLVIGAVLIPGASAPKIISRKMITSMKPGSVIVDCVANMPGAVPLTSTYALNQATLPYILKLANNGFNDALRDDPGFSEGLSVCNGHLTIAAVAEEHGYDYVSPMELINQV